MQWAGQGLCALKRGSNVVPEQALILCTCSSTGSLLASHKTIHELELESHPEIRPNHSQHETAAVPHCQQAPAPLRFTTWTELTGEPYLLSTATSVLVDSSATQF